MKILAVGDIHLGVRPSRLPEGLNSTARDLGPSGAWRRTVDSAVERSVDVVLLAGDVVNNSNDFFEGYRELRTGITELHAAGIEILGVAGNHDVRVLPRLADELPEFRLLGRGGVWESADLDRGGDRVRIWGWSFPEEKVRNSPLEKLPRDAAAPSNGLTIGLLHCDLDQTSSPYAPVSSARLREAGFDAWLLGHVHKPSLLTVADPVGYLGSLTGTDPGEPGLHGPWLLTTAQGSVEGLEQLPLAPMRWEAITLDLTEAADAEGAESLLVREIQTIDELISADGSAPNAVGLRVTLTGRTDFGAGALQLLREHASSQVVSQFGSTQYFVEKVANRTSPVADLLELAKLASPVGLLANRILLLERPETDPERRQFILAGRTALAKTASSPSFVRVGLETPTDSEVVEYLRMTAMQLLEAMMAQTGGI